MIKVESKPERLDRPEPGRRWGASPSSIGDGRIQEASDVAGKGHSVRIVQRVYEALFSPFWPIEKALISILEGALKAEAGAILRLQVGQYNRVRRPYRTPLQSFFSRVVFWHVRDPKPLFPNREINADLAWVSFRVAKYPERQWTARFYAFSGSFAMIAIRPNPKRIWRCREIEVTKLELRDDPMSKTPLPIYETPPLNAKNLTGWLREWAIEHKATQIRGPLKEEDRPAHMAKAHCKLPPDYLEIVAQTEGLTLDDEYMILGLSEGHGVGLKDGDYFLLCQIADEGYLGVREGSTDGKVWFLGLGGGESEDWGESFREAVEKGMARHAESVMAGRLGCLGGLFGSGRRRPE